MESGNIQYLGDFANRVSTYIDPIRVNFEISNRRRLMADTNLLAPLPRQNKNARVRTALEENETFLSIISSKYQKSVN